ncbi:MAG: 3-dehydroquinate synthase [Anaerovoracaceae bacterium]
MQIKIGRGIIDTIGSEAKEIITGETVVIVSDDIVNSLYGQSTEKALVDAGFNVETYVIPHGEESKNGETYLKILNFLAGIPLTRADGLVALGGGVVGDLTGFVAATYLRGIKVIQVPTTLLAAVDSSIGGKTAINLEAGKNLAGAFHQPSLVLCDVETLSTLPENIFRDGMAEVIKYGIITDKELFQELKSPGKKNLEDIIKCCAKIKCDIVEQDQNDTGVRQILNFGHTIGHAIEKASDFQISHGSAVAKGMAAITKISYDNGWCNKETYQAVIEILLKYEFDLIIDKKMEELYDIMKSDKKRKGNIIDIVVPLEIGKCQLKRITIEQLKELL